MSPLKLKLSIMEYCCKKIEAGWELVPYSGRKLGNFIFLKPLKTKSNNKNKKLKEENKK